MNVFKRVPAKPTHENLQYAQKVMLANGVNVSLSTCEMIYLAMIETSPELNTVEQPNPVSFTNDVFSKLEQRAAALAAQEHENQFKQLVKESFIDLFERVEALEGNEPVALDEPCDCDECLEKQEALKDEELSKLFAQMEALGVKVVRHRIE